MISRIPLLGTYLLRPHRIAKNLQWRFVTRYSDQRHIFVVGSPRSGTTLVENIIVGHPENASLQRETAFFTKKDLFDRKVGFPPVLPAETLKELRDESSDVVEYFDRCARLVCDAHDAQRFVEKTPQHVLLLRWLLKRFRGAQVVHVYRDGRDCFASAQSTNVPQRSNIVRFAVYWNRCIRSRFKVSSERVFDVKYEDLVRDPETVTQRLMRFLGQGFVSRQLSVQARKQDGRAETEKHSKLGKSISPRSVERWKADLTQREGKYFAFIAGRTLKALGYRI